MTRAEEIAIEAFFLGIHPADIYLREPDQGSTAAYKQLTREVWLHYERLCAKIPN